MNLSEPLDGVMSAVEAGALRVLARVDTGFSGRQVHALARVGSTSSVHRALTKFVNLGLVTAEARPPAIIYRVNRQHVLWPLVELGLNARTRTFDRIREFCAQDLAEVDLTVVIFGSVARRTSTPESDIDIFVIYPDGIDDDARADFSYQLAGFTERVTGNEAQVYSVERGEFARRMAENDPLVANVLADGIHIYGRSLHQPASIAA